MAKLQMILCFETNKNAGTDYMYVKDAIDHFFDIDPKIPINKVFMNGKPRYKHNDVVRQINELIKGYRGDSKVFYCIDTDQIDKYPVHVREFEDIKNYCEQKGYEFIWFCHDIEEVFLGNSISDKEKVSRAREFRTSQRISMVDVRKLQGGSVVAHTSNILAILGKYLVRK